MSTTYSNVKRKITAILTIFSVMMLCVALIPLRVHASTATLTLSDNTGTPATAANGTFTAYKVIDDRSITTDFADFFNNNATYGSYKFNGNEILNSAATIITGVQTDVTNSTEAAKLAVQLERYAAAKNLTGITFANNQAELSKGMWVVVETTSNGQTWTDNDGYQHTRIASRPMLVNMGDTAKTITLKDSSTSLRKTIDDNNVPVKTNDVAIGGTVNYNVESAIPMYEYNAQTRLAANALLFQIDDIFSAGLDYPGVGPEHAFLKDSGRVEYTGATDDEAVDALVTLCKTEGILPAIESSHALAEAIKRAPHMSPDQIIIVNVSGRGDKDVQQVKDYLAQRA